MAQVFLKTAQQKDNLCGPFWAARVLLEAGFIEWSGEPIDEDLIASRAELGRWIVEPDPHRAEQAARVADEPVTYEVRVVDERIEMMMESAAPQPA